MISLLALCVFFQNCSGYKKSRLDSSFYGEELPEIIDTMPEESPTPEPTIGLSTSATPTPAPTVTPTPIVDRPCTDGFMTPDKLNSETSGGFYRKGVRFLEGETKTYCFDINSVRRLVQAGSVNLGNLQCSRLELILERPDGSQLISDPGWQPNIVSKLQSGRWRLIATLKSISFGCDSFNLHAGY